MSSLLGEVSLPTQLLLAFALGRSAAPAIEPYVQDLKNLAWTANPSVPPDAVLLSVGAAQGKIGDQQAKDWAIQTGIGNDQFEAMVNIANVGPDLGLAYRAWRRGDLTDAQFATALKRTGLEEQWFTALEALKAERLELGALATAVHRGIMQDDGLLVTPVPQGSGNVPRIPVSSIDTLKEFAAQGIDPERARILVADTGLPLSLGEMLQLYNRNQVTDTDVKVSIAESNVRNEYMDVALELARQLLTPHEYAEADLRGVLDPATAKNGAGLSGLDPADYDTLFAILGRPVSVKQVTTGLARGGTYGGDYTSVPAGPYRDAIRRSAVRPEYADLDYANRYNYPSGFQIKSEAPTLGHDQTQQLLLEVGWSPHWADVFAGEWSGGAAGTKADPHVTKAQNQLWTATHSSYVKDRTDDNTAQTKLAALGVQASSIPAVLALWQEERELTRSGLTAAQIKKAYSEATFTKDEATARLVELGWSTADAVVYLGE